MEPPTVVAVSVSPTHSMAKANADAITLIAGVGIEGDAHAGVTVQHRSRVQRDPSQPNLRQVHLVHVELLEALRAQGFDLEPGRIGENVTTRGIDLLALPTAAVLRIGDAEVEVTGLRNPCTQLDGIQAGLMEACLDRAEDGGLIRLAGVMGIVRAGGVVRAGDAIEVVLPAEPHRPLQPV